MVGVVSYTGSCLFKQLAGVLPDGQARDIISISKSFPPFSESLDLRHLNANLIEIRLKLFLAVFENPFAFFIGSRSVSEDDLKKSK
jgi:hypothetical protein